MNDPDSLNPAIGIPLALILWAIVFYKPTKQKINDFFAHRRQLRRERNSNLRAVHQ